MAAAAIGAGSMRRAAAAFPGGFDWRYEVVSALASRKHNPSGAVWFAAGLLLAMLLLWAVVEHVVRRGGGSGAPLAGFVRWSLRAGAIGAALVGLDRLLFLHLSDIVRKGHEGIAVVSFLGWFLGVIGTYVQLARRRVTSAWPIVLVVLPLGGVAARQLALYLGQHGIGWVEHDWRAAGVPLWQSFAFWQWLAVCGLWAALGHLLWLSGRKAPSDL